MFGKVSDDSFTSIFDLSLDSEDRFIGSSPPNGSSNFQTSSNGSSTTSSSSPMSSRRDFSSPPSTPNSSSLPLEATWSQFAASFSSLLSENSASAVSASLDKKISELERLRNKINQESHSSASSTTSSGSTGSKVNTSRYKTELCRPFSEHGTCKYGEKCQFAHGQTELRTVTRHPKYKTDLCRTYHSVGFCPYGPRCHFVHNLDEASSSQQQQAPQQQQQQQQQQQPQQQMNKQQQQQQPNKPIGSGRLAVKEDPQLQQQKPLKPLPMFDNKYNAWSPLSSNLFEQQQQQQHQHQLQQQQQHQGPMGARLPVFSTFGK